MADSLKKFQHLIEAVKMNQDKTPEGTLKAFVHFLREMKGILKEASPQEREKIFLDFQSQQKDFEHAMKSLHLTEEKMKDPVEAQKIKSKIESEEFKELIKEMSDELFQIVKIMSEGKLN